MFNSEFHLREFDGRQNAYALSCFWFFDHHSAPSSRISTKIGGSVTSLPDLSDPPQDLPKPQENQHVRDLFV